jgi:RNA polymerase sigma-70 factor, ECF subfamily
MSVLATEPVLETRLEATAPRLDADTPLLEALRRRDPSAAERLVARFGDRAHRLAFGITRNAADAEEVVQDAFWNVIRKIDTFRGDSAFRSWSCRIVGNAAYQKRRGPANRRAELSLDAVLPLRLALTAAIAELPAEYHTPVLLRQVEGLSNSEVAETLGISVGSAKTRVHRARLFLRKRLAAAMTA